MSSKSPEDPSNLNILLTTNKKKRLYPIYPSIPVNIRHTRKYPRVKKIPGNTRSYISTLLPDPTRPATRYFVQYPTRPDPKLKNPTRWALAPW